MRVAGTLGRVMIIDDDPVDQMIYSRLLTRSGMTTEVISFRLAKEALEFILDPESPTVNLVLLDINMPAMNGFEFLEALRNSPGPAHLPTLIMMLTTSMNPRDRSRAMEFDEITAYVLKPLTIEHLTLALKLLDDAA